MKIALVTGGATGIGAATVRELGEQGIAVAFQYLTSDTEALALESELNKKNQRAKGFRVDLSKRDGAKELFKDVLNNFGEIDILINNAGLMTDSNIIEMSEEIWDETLQVNLAATFRLVKYCAPFMVKNKWGRIINISSQVALTGSANHAHYSAAKAGLLGFTYSAAKEFGKSGVTVNAVLPGRIETKMISERSKGRLEEWLSQTPLNRLGTPSEVSGVIAFLASERASYISGAAINVNGGLVMG
jgi:3-oxoacyl-[acyl-carrier protein] reductase